MPKHKIKLGIENLLEDTNRFLKGKTVGLVCNQASVSHNFEHIADLLWHSEGVNLKCFFGPQHGIRGEVQDNMIETPHTVDSVTNLPIHSLYSETREPTDDMLEGLDTILFDMQDVGCRIYTFVYTLANCMRAASRKGIKVIVCDRPNPINGTSVEGNLTEQGYESFVGQFPIPTRHGMTVGELAGLFNDEFKINCDLEVVKMSGWERELWFDETDAPWVLPSPNIPTVESATVFPGTVILEGTMLSEGRGTTRPFELVGASYCKGQELAKYLNGLGFEGVYFRPCGFQPTFQKFGGINCEGVQIHVLDRNVFKPVIVGVAIVKASMDLYPNSFKWKEPPYEYVFDKRPFDVIVGTDKLRVWLESGESLSYISANFEAQSQAFESLRKNYLLY